MRKYLNTLFVNTDGAILHREGETIDVRITGKSMLKLPVHLLESICCFGSVTVTPCCMQLCAERGVLISFMNMYGRFLARVSGPVNGNVLLRRSQYRQSDSEELSSLLARRVVIAKVSNSRAVLLRHGRDHAESSGADIVSNSANKLRQVLTHLEKPLSLNSVRGYEGEAAQSYFGVFDSLIIRHKNEFSFVGRNRRSPTDPVNALLSFFYTLLAHDCTAACESVGLDPQVGFLHRERPGRPSLALDIMEELRAPLCDRLALSLINRGQVRESDFRSDEGGAFSLKDEPRKAVLKSWQERKQEEIMHPFLEEKITWGQIPFVQALLLARFLRGDIDDYPSFLWK